MAKQLFVFVSIALQLLACAPDEIGVNSDVVLNYLKVAQRDSNIELITQIDSVLFAEVRIDTTNVLEYEKNIIILESELANIDSLNANEETLLYLKSILIADFVFARFGNQFLGTQFESEESANLKLNWNSYTLKRQYELGVQNKVAFDCGLKTLYFKALLKKLLNLETLDSSIRGVHTFPIVLIKKRQYLVDPSNPYVFYNQELNQILEFDELADHLEKMIPIQSNRYFRKTRSLISTEFYNHYFSDSSNLKNNLVNFSAQQNELIKILLPSCLDMQFEPYVEYSFLLNSANKIAMGCNQQSFGTFLSKMSIRRNYLNVNCEL